MHDVSCVLLSKNYKKDKNVNILKNKNGRESFEIIEQEIPIIQTEKVWKNEFYKASQLNLKPSIRIKISSLNYSNQEEIKYMGKHYTVIRVDGDNDDEIILVCERKSNNVKQ